MILVFQNKLEQYRNDLAAGKELNGDQQQAVANYECVLANLELMREMTQQFGSILTEHNKMMKKQMKREQIEKQQEEINKVKEILKVQVIYITRCITVMLNVDGKWDIHLLQ